MSMLSVLGQVLRILLTGKMLLGMPVQTADRQAMTRPAVRAESSRRDEPPEEGSCGLPDAGKPAPLRPQSGGHLVAANALPPSDRTYLLAKD